MSIHIDSNSRLHHDQEASFALVCPHCQVLSHMTAVSIPQFAQLSAHKPNHVGIVYRCDSCNAPVFLKFPVKIYAATRVELAPNYLELERPREKFTYTYLPEESELLFKEALGCYAQNFQGINPVAMGGEIAADIGAAKALVERLRGFSPEEAFSFIKKSVGPLCGSVNDGVHPSDRFRINVILGQDPDIAALLGCSQQGQVCTLNGAEGVRR